VSREVLYNILVEFGVPMKLPKSIKMCLNETYSKVRIGNHLSVSFPIPNGLKHVAVITYREHILLLEHNYLMFTSTS
jgi:hypothetical protein